MRRVLKARKFGGLSLFAWILIGCLEAAGSHQAHPSGHAPGQGSPGLPGEGGAESVRLVNDVRDCLAVEKKRIDAYRNLRLLVVGLHRSKSVGECGCVSNVLRFSVEETIPVDNAHQRYERAFGVFSPPDGSSPSSEYVFVLDHGSGAAPLDGLELTIGCKGPD